MYTSLIKQLKKHALAHYEEGGWDFLVECWDDWEIEEELSSKELEPDDFEGAKAHFCRVLGIVDERRTEVQSFIF
ncbi:MAG: hypothetical protein OEY01_03380 [Desulfobulbaceae bacterium]|nr:hypothetical protein [Desulfobulbaceae bacterium]